MDSPAEPPAPGRGRIRLRPVFVTAIVLFLLAFAVTFRFTVRPSRTLARWAESEIAKLVAPDVKISIADARIDASAPALVLRGIRLGSDLERPDVEIARVRVEVALGGAAWADVARVVVERPRIRVAAVRKLLPESTGEPPKRIPAFHVREASLEFDVEDVGTLVFGELDARGAEVDPQRLRVEGTVRTPFEGLLHVQGLVDLETGRLDVGVSTDAPINLARPSGATLNPTIEEWRRRLEPQGEVSLTARLQRAREGDPFKGAVEVSASGLAATVPGLGLRPVDCSVGLWLGDDGVGRFEAKGRALTADFSALGEVRATLEPLALTSVNVGAQVAHLTLGNDVQRLLHSIDEGAEDVYHGLNPEGPVSATLSLGYDASRPGIEVAADIDLDRVRVIFEGIPGGPNDEIDAKFAYPVRDVQGRISYREGRIVLAGLQGRMGTGRLRFGGEVIGEGLVGIDLFGRVDELPIDDAIAKAIEGLPDGAETWKMFQLDGRLDFDLQVTRPQGQRKARVVVRVESQGTASGSFRDLPVAVTGLQGSVMFDRGVSTFAFDGHASNGRVRIEGNVDDTTAPDGSEPTRSAIRLRVAGHGFDVDDTLANAFDVTLPDVAEQLRAMQPRVVVDFEYAGERPRDSPMSDLRSLARIEGARGVVTRVPAMDVKLDDMAFTMHVASTPRPGDEVDVDLKLDSLDGRYRGHPALAVLGMRRRTRSGATRAASAPPGEQTLDLQVAGIDLPFDRELVTAMGRAGSEAMGTTLDRYDFGGRIDFTMARRVSPLVDLTSFGVELRNAAIRGPGLPGTCDQLVGYLTYENEGPLRAKTIEGKLDGVPVALEDFFLDPGIDAAPLRLGGVLSSVQPIDFATALLKSVPEAKSWLDTFGLQAQLEPKQLGWELTVPDQGDMTFRSSGSVYARSGVLPDVKVTGLQGPVTFEDLVFDGQGFRTRLRLSDASFAFAGRPVRDFRGLVEFSPTELFLREVHAGFASGAIRPGNEPFFHLNLTETPKTWGLNLVLDGAELSKLLEGAAPGDLTGLVRADLMLTGKGGDLLSYAGRGALNVTNASLFDVPLFKAIYQGLQFKRKPTFHQMVGRFVIRPNGIVEVDELNLESDPIGLQGQGRLYFDGTVQLFFGIRIHVPLFDLFGVISAILGFVTDQFVTIEVVGNVENPRITPRPSLSPRSSQARKQIIAPQAPLELGERF